MTRSSVCRPELPFRVDAADCGRWCTSYRRGTPLADDDALRWAVRADRIDTEADVPRTGGAPAPNVQEAGTGVSNLYGLDWPACEGSAARPELPISPRSSRCGMGSSAAPVREETASTARLDGGAALGAGAEDGRMTALLATSPVQPPHNLRNQVLM